MTSADFQSLGKQKFLSEGFIIFVMVLSGASAVILKTSTGISYVSLVIVFNIITRTNMKNTLLEKWLYNY